MKKKLYAVSLVLLSSMSLFAAQTSVTGVLTDDMCTKKHMMSGKSNADCVRDCIKHGAKYVVVSEGKVYVIKASPDLLNPVAGKKVTIKGDVKGDTIIASSVEAAR
jgi:hypothetical protein